MNKNIKNAPHLPGGKDSLGSDKTVTFLPLVLLVVLVAGLASVAVTLITLVRITPALVPDQSSFFGRVQREKINAVELEPSLANQARQRIWEVRDTRTQVGDGWYRTDASARYAMMLTADGWAVALDGGYVKGSEKFWQGYDHQGASFAVEKVVQDKTANLLYLKFVGSGFPVSSFANWDRLDLNETFFVYSGAEWAPVLLEKNEGALPKSYVAWQPQFVYFTSPAGREKSILISPQGELVGFVGDGGELIYGWLAEHQIASVFESGKALYEAGNWQGYNVEGVVNVLERTKKIKGFYVESSPTVVSSSTLGVGDLITHVQNQPVDELLISRQILFAPNPFTARVFRGGAEVEIRLNKNKVSF